MRKVLSCAAIAALVVACTIDSDKMDNHEAWRAYLAPTFCAKEQQCEPLLFSTAFCTQACRDVASTDTAEAQRLQRVECERKYNEEIRKQELELTNCTNEEYQQCRADMNAAACPAANTTEEAIKTGGRPPLPPSCSKC